MFDQVVERMMSARTIYIIGVRSSMALATFLNFHLRNMLHHVRLVEPYSISEMLEQLVHVGPQDVVISISFPRYSSRTIKAMDFCRKAGATVVAITDTPEAPGARVSTHVLLAKSDMVSIVDSLVAPMSVINALIVSVGRKNENDLSRTYEELEQIWEEYEAYERMEN